MIDDTPKTGYFRRQVYVLGSLGLFYVIILALFAIPLLGTFVVILIKGVLDLRYVILAGFALLGIGALVLLVRLVRRLVRKFRTDGTLIRQNMQEYMQHGQPVQLSLFKGLLTFSYGAPAASSPVLIENSPAAMPLLPSPPSASFVGDNQPITGDYCLARLEVLADLQARGLLTPNEFARLKARLLDELAAQSKDDLAENPKFRPDCFSMPSAVSNGTSPRPERNGPASTPDPVSAQ